MVVPLAVVEGVVLVQPPRDERRTGVGHNHTIAEAPPVPTLVAHACIPCSPQEVITWSWNVCVGVKVDATVPVEDMEPHGVCLVRPRPCL